jgi:hypothetical protein
MSIIRIYQNKLHIGDHRDHLAPKIFNLYQSLLGRTHQADFIITIHLVWFSIFNVLFLFENLNSINLNKIS